MGLAIWRYIPIVSFWSIWEERNLRIIQDEKRDVDIIIHVIAFRIASWASSLDLFQGISINVLLRDLPSIIKSAWFVPQIRHYWRPPMNLAIKLNFNGCSLGNPGPLVLETYSKMPKGFVSRNSMGLWEWGTLILRNLRLFVVV